MDQEIYVLCLGPHQFCLGRSDRHIGERVLAQVCRKSNMLALVYAIGMVVVYDALVEVIRLQKH